MRLDKYLKVSRLIKRRTVANEACDAGRVSVNGRSVKASYDVKPGDVLEIQFAQRTLKVEVLAVVGGEFMRYDGLAKVVMDDALLAKVREIMPQIMDMYDKNGWEMGLFYLENGHAEIRGILDMKEEFDV